MGLLPEQQINLVAVLLGANLTIAAILFGVLGFLYAVFAQAAVPKLPDSPITEMKHPVYPHPILDAITRLSRFILIGLFLSLLLTISCMIWFYCRTENLLIGIVCGLLFESVVLSVLGAIIVFSLIPAAPRIGQGGIT